MMQAVVLAGGRGTRLRERVADLPKPMAPVAGRPFLEYLLGWLARCGVQRVVLSVGYKAEVIEAHFLFDLPYESIEVVVHPQSVVHSFVEFVDGSVVAQMSVPSMELPVLYALTHPERAPDTANNGNNVHSMADSVHV